MRKQKREIIGTVISRKMQKTAIVAVERTVRAKQFKKTILKSTHFKVHDEKNECQAGDTVLMTLGRPISKEKSWKIEKILKRGFEEGGGGS